MTQWLANLVGLDGAQVDAHAPVVFDWQAGTPRWLIFALVCLLAILLVQVYRADVRRARRRIAPALLRAAVFAGVLAIACKPALVVQHERVQRSRAVVVIDTSASMAQRDAAGDVSTNATRLEHAVRALQADDAAALRTLVSTNDVDIFAVDAGLNRVADVREGTNINEENQALAALAPTGNATRLAASVAPLVEERGGPPLSAVVLISDGQDQSRDQAARLIAAAQARRVPIHVVPLGSPRPPRDLAVAALELAGGVYAGDLLTVRATVQARGLIAEQAVEVTLFDDETGDALTTTQVALDEKSPSAVVELPALPARSGQLPLRVTATPLADEHDTDNNTARGAVEVLAEHLHVLFVEGYPRFEYRYLKNALLREPTIQLSCLLLSADEDFAQEGTEPIRRFPETTEELARFDVIILGDVDPHGYWVSRPQLDLLADFVTRGGGLAVIAGERHTPHDFRGTPLEALLPVRIDPAFAGTYASTLTEGFHPQITPAGREAAPLRWRANAEENARLFDALPPLYWFARTRGPQPGAEVLLEYPAQDTEGEALPIMVAGRCGAGRTFFAATDDTWRWRRERGELVYDTFWVRAVRSLAPRRADRMHERMTLVVDPPVARLGDSVRVRAQIRDPQLVAQAAERWPLVLRDAEGFVRQRIDLKPIDTGTNPTFAATFVPREPGEYELTTVDDSALGTDAVMRKRLRVEAASVETRDLRADPEYLRSLAEATGGRVVALDELPAVFATIEDRSRRTPDDISAPLWDTPIALGLVMVLLASEWIVRRMMGMA